MERTFKAYITEDPKAAELKASINTLEAELAQVRWRCAQARRGLPSAVDGCKLWSRSWIGGAGAGAGAVLPRQPIPAMAP